jgi:hypothetical protein
MCSKLGGENDQRASEAGLTKNQQRKRKNNQEKQQKQKQVQFEGI